MRADGPDRPAAGGRSPGADDDGRRWWARAGSFVATHAGKLALGVLGAAAVAIFVPILVSWWNSLTTTGEPVAVRVEVEEKFEDVTLPGDAELTDSERAELSTLSSEAQATWLEKHEHGIVAGDRTVVLTLRGNRPDMVRVTDVRAITECGTPPRGTLVRLATGRGGGPVSLHANIDLDEPDEARESDPDTGEMSSYFPERTITLEHDEEEVLIIDLYPRDELGIMCDVVLELTVFDRDREVAQRVLDDGEPFHLMWSEPSDVESEYDAVYLGGMLCRNYVEAPSGWERLGPSVCGPGNEGEM